MSDEWTVSSQAAILSTPCCQPTSTIANADFRKLGLFAIDSVNPNCWSGAREHLVASSADIALFQEVRLPEDRRVVAEGQVKSLRWSASLSSAALTKSGGLSAGVAVATRAHIGMADPAASPGIAAEHRLRLKHVSACCRGGLHVGSAYFHCLIGADGEPNLNLLHAIASQLVGINGPWVIGADWNFTPSELTGTGWLELVGGAIVAPNGPSCNGKVYDYFVVSKSLLHAVAITQRLDDSVHVPHTGVRLLLRSRLRAVCTRTLVAPSGFRANLPFGPAPCPLDLPPPASSIAAGASVRDLDVDAEYSRLICSIERDLCDICGLHGRAAIRHSGRSAGPRVKLTPVAAGLANKPCGGASQVAKAWALLTKWLRSLARAPGDSIQASDAIRKLLFHNHDLSGSSPPGHIEEFLSFRRVISRPSLLTPFWVDWFLSVASRQSDLFALHAANASRESWRSWLHDGPAHGLRRQHRMSRTVAGWVPSATIALPCEADDAQPDDPDDAAEIVAGSLQANSTRIPLGLQATAESEVGRWSTHWGSGLGLPPCQWPVDLGELPPRLTLLCIQKALLSFAAGTGLGWDAIHPRALLRLPDATLLALARLLFLAEAHGRWPEAVLLVLIVLIPKSDGGRRPIGLFPWLPRIWMRARRCLAHAWEAANPRPFLYAGVGAGADIAGWRQAYRGEAAVSVTHAAYGQTLLDVVKAFDTVPHDVLVREAIALHYPLWILRLAIAAYLGPRRIRIDGALSDIVIPERGLTAGSGTATTELRVLLFRIVDRAWRAFPLVTPTLFVDDLSAEASGGPVTILRELAGFTSQVCRDMTANKLQVSPTKSLCSASSTQLGDGLQRALSEFGVTFQSRVKSLGTPLGGGTRRNVGPLNARLKAFRARRGRFRALANAGVRVDRLMRTGGVAALSYGEFATGVSPSMLLQQRRAVAACTSRSAGFGGQCLDRALLVADGARHGHADPAHAAHSLPIGYWAQAIWSSWFPRAMLKRSLGAVAKRTAKVRHPWSIANGPSAAFLLSAKRLRWSAVTAFGAVLDNGKPLDFRVDPPIVVVRETQASVRRWRLSNIQSRSPFLPQPSDGHSIVEKPLLSLLFPTPAVARGWPAHHAAGLCSAFCQRQWPQERLHRAGKATHDKCIACERSLLAESGNDDLPPEVHASLPVGSLAHRVCFCPALAPQRGEFADKLALLKWPDGGLSPMPSDQWMPSLASGLFTYPFSSIPSAAAEASFEWVRQPTEQQRVTKFYTDGSQFDTEFEVTTRLGWAFIGVNASGHIIAIARGVPPSWITNIPGAEAWALLQAAYCSVHPDTHYVSDCLPAVDSVHKGRAWACSGRRPLARVMGLLHSALDDTPRSNVVWMPAHTAAHQVGIAHRGDGSILTSADRYCNALADSHAKIAARHSRVSKALRDDLHSHSCGIVLAMRWLGVATWDANHSGPNSNLRDSTASKSAAAASRARLHASRYHGVKRAFRPAFAPLSPAEGGHLLLGTPEASWCSVCLVRGPYRSLAEKPCSGLRNVAWRRVAADGAVSAGDEHSLRSTGAVQWCLKCGSFSESRAKLLAHPCTGHITQAQRNTGGGRYQQLHLLQKGLHPKSGRPLVGNTRPPDLGPAPALATASSCAAERLSALRQRVRDRTAPPLPVPPLPHLTPLTLARLAFTLPAPPRPPGMSRAQYAELRSRARLEELDRTPRPAPY